MKDTLHVKYDKLLSMISGWGSAAVAFSGGTDSSFLCYCAVTALGSRSIAVTVVSPMLPQSELESARAVAAFTGITHVLLEETDIDGEVAANPKDRCYYCKKLEFGAIIKAAAARGITTVLDGSNTDDLSDWRPGMRALSELQIQSPLREAGLCKAEIRKLSREFKLPTWDKPAFACLASRFPYGERIDSEKLKRVEKAEAYLQRLGFRQIRVRSHNAIARIEVAPDERRKFFDEALLDTISGALKSFGFLFVSFELEGYKMGSLNAEIDTTS
ncbi:MAG: ATP-dependent sacrificial sulfur transferase LarE [Spirochaetaceae bacterium]|jgi:uncharacterized protein|nr:ATP-dependent sacrificial sulfur transferase LarE [Spirochaetaceae bacterium]